MSSLPVRGVTLADRYNKFLRNHVGAFLERNADSRTIASVSSAQ